MTVQLQNQMTKYFGVVYPGHSAAYLRSRIDQKSIVRYGRLRMGEDGDHRVRTAKLIAGDPAARDNSFVRVSVIYLCSSF